MVTISMDILRFDKNCVTVYSTRMIDGERSNIEELLNL